MVTTVTAALRPLTGVFRAILVVLALLALLMTTSIAAPRARAASTPLRAVLIVGPSSDSSLNKTRADTVASLVSGYGMAVSKVYTPHATWSAVLNVIQGANLVIYWGHGNGWPSPYGPFQEKTKDGFGLNATDGSSTVAYYGGNYIRNNVKLANNAIVGLNHACYSAGNGEPGMAIPTYDVARQRVDNFAAAFLAVGSRAVFALETGDFPYLLTNIFTSSTSKTMDQVFSTRGADGLAWDGFVGWNDKYFDSQRMPGFKNHLDPESSAGYRRAVSGDMSMTTADWMAAAGTTFGGGGSGGAGTTGGPVTTAPRASFVSSTSGKSNVTLHLDWDAATPATNVAKYELSYSVDSSTTWTPVTLASPTGLSVNVALAPGHYYKFALRATDTAGAVGAWAYSTNRKLVRRQETSSYLVYGGTWSSQLYLAGASGSYVKKGSTGGQTVSYTFSGVYASFVTTYGPDRGMAEVWLDGSRVATLDLYSATTQTARMAWVASVASGTHTVQVKALGTKNAAASAARVDVDAFVIWK